MDRTVTLKQEETSGHEPQPELDTKTDRLTDRQSQCDFDFDLTETLGSVPLSHNVLYTLKNTLRIRNSAHRKPLTVFFNSSSGSTIGEAVNVQHISIFGICEDVRHFTQNSYDVTINSHNGQLTLDTDSHASDSGTVWRERRTILGAISKLLYSKIALFRKPFGIGHMYIYALLPKMTDTVTSQNINLSSWDTVYKGKRPCGRFWCGWEDNIKVDFIEIWWEGVDWIIFA
jgi:hypothetical protein